MTSAARFEAMLAAVWRRSDELFDSLPREALTERPIPLRHPFVFYLGHLPAFAWNQVGRQALGQGDLRPALDRRFERGIDPATQAEARALSTDAWPPHDELVSYRDSVRSALRALLTEVLRRDDPLCARGRILHLVVEHEMMHHETLMYMLAARARGIAPAFDGGDGRAAEPRWIPAGRAVLGTDAEAVDFAWDNELPRTEVAVAGFTIDSLPVRNRDYLDYVRALSGSARAAALPCAHVLGERGLMVKTVAGLVPFDLAAGWPAQVTGEQATAYAAFRGGRLPTEAELHRAAFCEPGGGLRPFPWGHEPPAPCRGNFGFCGRAPVPVPVGRHPDGASAWGVEELVGNGWEWSCTPFLPRPGFAPCLRSYPGYSADFFDGAHNVVFGASWATDERLVRRSFRNWYRRDYPYVFSSFRVVTSCARRTLRA